MIDEKNVHLEFGDVLDKYDGWETPECIVSDGAYGIDGFNGDTRTVEDLIEWYRPHVIEWSRLASPSTTLWFWNTEIGWAKVNSLLEDNGWRYVRCNIWDKGVAHVAGNCNLSMIRQFPCSSEVCVQYVRDGSKVQCWLRSEWMRTGLPLYEANDACGVANAATRKYLTEDDAFYFPPDKMFVKMRDYANEHGDPAGAPYFTRVPGFSSDVGDSMERYRAKFHCPCGVTNVWRCPSVHGEERIRGTDGRFLHPNQKPLELMDLTICSCTDPGDVVWEPFGGVFSASLSACLNGRIAYGSEINRDYYDAGVGRFVRERGRIRQTELF